MAPRKKKQQQRMPGTDGDRHQDVDDLVADIHEITKRWQDLGEEMTTKRATLAVLLREHKLSRYRDIDHDPPLLITLTPGKDKVSIKKDTGNGDEA